MPFKRISADETKAKLEERKELVRDTANGLAIMRATKSPPSWDPDKRSARFIMSSETVDRYRDIVVQSGLDIERFMENPQALLFHNSRSWPIGNWSDVTKVLGGRPKRTEGVLNFMPAEMDPDSDRAAMHVAAGTIRTVSIGFRPDWDEVEMILDDEGSWTGGFRYTKSELLECSLVPIPAQPDAMVKDANGDMALAKELIEEVLDNWAKTPEGLLVPRCEYEAAYRTVVEKIAADQAPAGEASAEDEVSVDAADGEETRADVDPDEQVETRESETEETETPAAGDHDISAEGQPVESRSEAAHIPVEIRIDSSQAEAEIGRIGGLLDGIAEKIGKIFGRSKELKRIEPVVDTPPSPEAVDAAKSRAAEALARIQARGL